MSECRTSGMSTDCIDNHVTLPGDGYSRMAGVGIAATYCRFRWLAFRPVGIKAATDCTRAYCDVYLLFITALSSLLPRHLIRPDYRVIAIYPTAASDSCTRRRRDEEVRKTFAFL